METNKKKTVTLTEKRIASAKLLHVICAIAAMALNVIAFAVVAINVSITEFTFLVLPLALAVLDIIFFVRAILSNYRFSYAVRGAVIHAVTVLLVSAAAYAVMGILETRVIFVKFAIYAMLAVHVLQSIATIVTALQATKGGKSFARIMSVLFTVVFLAGAAIYGRFLLTEGFFGQGGYADYRTVVYEYNAETNSYTATDVLDGYGTSVVIPDTFDGLSVNYIDCVLFTHEELTYVRVDCEKEVGFLNIDRLNHVNPSLELLAPRSYIDTFRAALYAVAHENESALSLANHVYPSDLKENEVYVSFSYTRDTLSLTKGKIMPTWIEEKGTVLDVTAKYGAFDFINKSDAKDVNDLYWCYTNQNKMIFKSAENAEGENFVGKKIESSVNVSLVFEKIYRVIITEDNDDKYIIDDVYRFIKVDGKTLDHRLATKENVMARLQALPGRNGFDLVWKTGSNRHTLADIGSELALLDEAGRDDLTVYPEWQLKAPTIDTLTADGAESGHKAVYGSNVSLASSATSPDASISIRYEWYHNNASVSSKNTHEINNIHPEDAGRYILKVTAGGDETTSLTNTVSKEIEVGFEKKALDFSWNLPEKDVDDTYSATNKQVSAEYNSFQVINNDVITFKLYTQTLTSKTEISASNPIRNAGTYNLLVELTSDAATKYQIPDSTETLTIKQYPINVNWSNVTQFEYDGSLHKPTATVNPLGSDVVALSISGEQKNYSPNPYTATAETTNKNYELKNNTVQFKITQRPVTVKTWDKDIFVYNSKNQHPQVTVLNNTVTGENKSVIDSIIYTGAKTDVGEYNITVSLPASSNYKLTGTVAKSFRIDPKPITVTIDDKTMTYNGSPYTYASYTFSVEDKDIAENDKIGEIVSLKYKGAAINAVNASSTGYVIDADIVPGSKYKNYDVSLVTALLRISKKPLSIKINNAVKTYNGAAFTANNAAANGVSITGLAATDKIEEVLALKYKGTAIGAVNYSALGYTIDADVSAGTKYANYEVTITAGTLTVNRAPLSVIAVGGEKVYDGAECTGFSFKVTGLVGSDKVSDLGAPQYGGEATYMTSAGTHKLTVSFKDNSVTNNYEITSASGEFVIKKKPITVTAMDGTKTYNGVVTGFGAFDFEVKGLIPSESKAMLGTPVYGGEATTNKNAGAHKLTVTLPANSVTANYEITYEDGTYTITKKKVTVSFVSGSKTYDGKPGSYDFEVNGLALSDSKSVLGTPTYTHADEKNVGKYSVSVSLPGNENYTITSYTSGTYEIKKRALTITAVSSSKEYDGKAGGSFSVTTNAGGLAAGESIDLLGTVTYGSEARNAKNAGAYDLTFTLSSGTAAQKTAAGNYEIKLVYGTFTITKKNASVILSAENKTYDGTAGGKFSAVAEGLASGDTLEGIGKLTFGGDAKDAKNAGRYTLTASFEATGALADNYNVTIVDCTFEIYKKKATVTAVAESKVFDGTAGGNFSIVTDGVLEEDKATLGEPTFGGEALAAVNSGKYALTVVLPDHANYDFEYVNGEFDITAQ